MKAYLVAGLAYGDEGKGSVVDYLVRKHGSKLVVRYNGGPQASHNVVTADGRHHAFSQFGSGSLVPGVKTFLSRYMLIEPYALLNEWSELSQKIDSRPLESILAIDGGCPVITPYHWIVNRLREDNRDSKHGTCGMGIGELRADQELGSTVLYARDLTDPVVTRMKLDAIRARKIRQAFAFCGCVDKIPEAIYNQELAKFYLKFSDMVRIMPEQFCFDYSETPVIFEGAQGVLLDEKYGFAPYNTWTDTTFANAMRLLPGNADATKVGVLRTYFTRHGPGPFVTEAPYSVYPDHNATGDWQGPFRQGWFDLSAAVYAVQCIGGIDVLALNCLDRTGDPFRVVPEYVGGERETLTRMKAQDTHWLMQAKPGTEYLLHVEMTRKWLGFILGAGSRIDSYGPTANDKEEHVLDRRSEVSDIAVSKS